MAADERVEVIEGENLKGGNSALGGGAGDKRAQTSDSINSITTGVCSHLQVIVEEQLQGADC